MLLVCAAAAAFASSTVPGASRVAARGRFSICMSRSLMVPSRDQDGSHSTTLPVLPALDAEEEMLVQSGKCLRWQQPPDADNPAGTGFAVQEISADADDVWRAVSAFSRYPELISTVRTATAYHPPDGEDDEPANVCRYSFLVSRIRLILNVRFVVDDSQRYVSWRLDRPSWVLDDSTGYWRVQLLPERPGKVRVWFCVGVRLKRVVPRFVVSLVSRLGLSKATNWLRDLGPPA